MVMKLYGMGTTNVHRALLPLYEKGVDEKEFKLVKVDITKGEQKHPAFLAKQPFGYIPYLEDGEIQLYGTTRTPFLWTRVQFQFLALLTFSAESRSIARYLNEKYEDQGVSLLGKTMQERATINQWAEVETQNFRPASWPIFLEIFMASMEKRPVDQALIASSTVNVEKVLDVYEERLSKNKYLAGDSYSLADLLHVPWMYRLLNELQEVFKSRKHVYAWAKDITSRPAFKKVLETNSKWEEE